MNRRAPSWPLYMVTATRLLLITLTLGFIPVFLVFIAPEGPLMQVAGSIVILLLVSLNLFTGRSRISVSSSKTQIVVEEEMNFGDIELPPPILSEESTSEIRDSKIRRSRGRKAAEEPPEMELPLPFPNPNTVSMEEGSPLPDIPDEDVEGLAKIHVAKSDPELMAEAEVDRYLEQQRARRSVFRERLQRERRSEMSHRKAEEARKWADLEDGEDLSTITKIPGHGLAVMYEPEDPDPSIPQGISYFRIDDHRILKIRVSLDVPDTSRTSWQEESGQDSQAPIPPLPLPPDMEMPPPLPELPPPVSTDD